MHRARPGSGFVAIDGRRFQNDAEARDGRRARSRRHALSQFGRDRAPSRTARCPNGGQRTGRFGGPTRRRPALRCPTARDRSHLGPRQSAARTGRDCGGDASCGGASASRTGRTNSPALASPAFAASALASSPCAGTNRPERCGRPAGPNPAAGSSASGFCAARLGADNRAAPATRTGPANGTCSGDRRHGLAHWRDRFCRRLYLADGRCAPRAAPSGCGRPRARRNCPLNADGIGCRVAPRPSLGTAPHGCVGRRARIAWLR